MEACLYFIYYRLGMDKCDKLAIFLSGYEYFVKHYKSFLIFFPYRIKKTKKCLAVFIIYVINALVDSIVILSLTKYTMGQPVNQVYECITSFALLFIAIIIQRTTEPEKEITLPALNMAALLMVPVVSIVYIYYLIIVAHEIKEIVIFQHWHFFLLIFSFFICIIHSLNFILPV